MAAASSSLSEDQFLCSICLDVFTDPVSTPCGHNFCKNCITTHWNFNAHYQCPNCNKVFNTRPELQVNTFVSKMVSHFRQSVQQRASSSEQQAAEPGDVPCDVCTGPKVKALKSCLVCLVSYCETHLEAHLTASGLKRHQLIDPVKNLEGRMCTKHNKPVELFCKTDEMCLCMLCSVLDHKSHDVAPVKKQYEKNLAKLGKTRATIQQMIKERQFKIQELQDSVSISREIADREIANCNHVFTKLKEAIERNQAKVIESTEEKHRMTEKQAEGFIKELEQEISELKKRSSELEQLLFIEDHLDFLQNFSSLDAAPPTKNWTQVKVCLPSYKGTVGTAVDQLVEMLKNEMKKLLTKSELKKVQQYAVDVTLDPDTVNPRLILSEDGKQVHDGGVWKDLPENPKRFSHGVCVLGKQFVSSGRFYFEVQVKGKPDWGLGVAAESVNRKRPITVSPNNGYWTIHSRKGNFCLLFNGIFVPLFLTLKPEKVGVFVDYDEGLVSFYDVDAAALIDAHIGCSFTGNLHPVFLPCANQGGKTSAPLIICPVNPTLWNDMSCSVKRLTLK